MRGSHFDGVRTGEHAVRARMIGEWRGGDLVWGVELAWGTDDGERYRRACALTDEWDTVYRFCYAVERGGVSPIHADDMLRDFCHELAAYDAVLGDNGYRDEN